LRATPAGQPTLAVANPSPTDKQTAPRSNGPTLCKQGFVWRTANAQDHVCVTPAVRQKTVDDSTLGPHRQVGRLQAGKPAMCKQGYVWRQANAADYICVTPQARAAALADNRAAGARTS